VQRRTCHFGGRVQGVGFRYTVQNLAQQFDVRGYVKNLPDRRVELVMEGEASEMNDLVNAIEEKMNGFNPRAKGRSGTGYGGIREFLGPALTHDARHPAFLLYFTGKIHNPDPKMYRLFVIARHTFIEAIVQPIYSLLLAWGRHPRHLRLLPFFTLGETRDVQSVGLDVILLLVLIATLFATSRRSSRRSRTAPCSL
jgi:acylphosphatase